MTITINKTVTTQEELNFKNLKVVRTNSIDIDSTNLEIFYNQQEIGCGQLNTKTNFAHVTINEDLFNEGDLFKQEKETELENYLVDGIEKRTINFS